jgi:hypothetical protein
MSFGPTLCGCAQAAPDRATVRAAITAPRHIVAVIDPSTLLFSCPGHDGLTPLLVFRLTPEATHPKRGWRLKPRCPERRTLRPQVWLSCKIEAPRQHYRRFAAPARAGRLRGVRRRTAAKAALALLLSVPCQT